MAVPQGSRIHGKLEYGDGKRTNERVRRRYSTINRIACRDLPEGGGGCCDTVVVSDACWLADGLPVLCSRNLSRHRVRTESMAGA